MNDSDRVPLNPSKTHGVSEFDFVRLERKVDRMSDALDTLIRVEERQTNQGKRIGDIESQVAVNSSRIDIVKADLDKWVNRGMGAWAVALIVWGALKFFAKV